MSELEVKNLLLQNEVQVSFRLKKGELLIILGANGCGKSTLLRAILGLQYAKSGEIFLNDKKLTSKDINKGLISYVPQFFDIKYPLTVREIVELGAVKGMSISKSKNSFVENILEKLHLQNLKDRFVDTLSGGEKAKVSLARALMQNANFMLLDEPDSSLDLKSRVEFKNLLLEIIAEDNAPGIAMVTHDLFSAFSFSRNVLFGCFYKNKKFDVVPYKEITGEILTSIYDIPIRVYENNGYKKFELIQ